MEEELKLFPETRVRTERLTFELLLLVVVFLFTEDRCPAPDEIADSLRFDPARPFPKLEEEDLVAVPAFRNEDALRRPLAKLELRLPTPPAYPRLFRNEERPFA